MHTAPKPQLNNREQTGLLFAPLCFDVCSGEKRNE